MKKIMVIPLDERPCNTHYIRELAKQTEYQLLMPPLSILGDKKNPANLVLLHQWIIDYIGEVDECILSIDMLLYGGIVPSRLHHMSECTLMKNMSLIKQMKTLHPKLKIHAFQLIMRCPSYSSSDEEPDYYEEYGKEIHRIGILLDLKRLNRIQDLELEELDLLLQKVPSEVLTDYKNRRNCNLKLNQAVIQLVNEGWIEDLVIPQDDNAIYGYTHMEYDQIVQNPSFIKSSGRIDIYPDADAVGLSIFARILSMHLQQKLKVFVDYPYPEVKKMIPLFEGVSIETSLSHQMKHVFLEETNHWFEADFVLMVNASEQMLHRTQEMNQEQANMLHKRDISNLVKRIAFYIHQGIKVSVADILYPNGSDPELMEGLIQNHLYFQLNGYAAWNTSGNTIGTVLTQSIINLIYPNQQDHLNFLGLRLVEDDLYMTKVRYDVSMNRLKPMHYNYFSVDATDGKVASIVKEELNKELENLKLDYEIIIDSCKLPWKRMFEVALEVHVKSK